jgi:hypothetical protein
LRKWTRQVGRESNRSPSCWRPARPSWQPCTCFRSRAWRRRMRRCWGADLKVR